MWLVYSMAFNSAAILANTLRLNLESQLKPGSSLSVCVGYLENQPEEMGPSLLLHLIQTHPLSAAKKERNFRHLIQIGIYRGINGAVILYAVIFNSILQISAFNQIHFCKEVFQKFRCKR